jgi:probable addiction module antidote protein
MVETTRFDAAEYLDTAERQAAYITVAFATGDPAFVRDALSVVARAMQLCLGLARKTWQD